MLTEVIPLGSGSALPTRERHLSGLVIQREAHLLLFDCGEGTQFQLMRAGLKRARIEAIFITHFHGDHYFGLMGLYSTIALLGRDEPLTLVGPRGLQEILTAMPGLLERPAEGFPVRFVEIEPDFNGGVVYENHFCRIEARPLDHRIFVVGYRYEEKERPGRMDVEAARQRGVSLPDQFRRLKAGMDVELPDGRRVHASEVVGPPQPGPTFAYVTDTRPCENGVALGRDADLLYHEATFATPLSERAVITGHSTGAEAGRIAAEAGARRLILGHFSARYEDPAPIVAEAREVFPETEAVRELTCYPLTVSRSTPLEQRSR